MWISHDIRECFWNIKIRRKKFLDNSWDFCFRKCANSKRKIRQNLKMILNGRLSEQPLKATIIYRKEPSFIIHLKLRLQPLTVNSVKHKDINNPIVYPKFLMFFETVFELHLFLYMYWACLGVCLIVCIQMQRKNG